MLKVEDLTQETVLVDHGRLANTFWTRLRGLMGVRDLPTGDGLLLKPANQIHTHFMAIPIDVLYLDKEQRVVDMDAAMPPGKFGRLRRKARAVLELPAGSIQDHGVQPGDQLRVTVA